MSAHTSEREGSLTYEPLIKMMNSILTAILGERLEFLPPAIQCFHTKVTSSPLALSLAQATHMVYTYLEKGCQEHSTCDQKKNKNKTNKTKKHL